MSTTLMNDAPPAAMPRPMDDTLRLNLIEHTVCFVLPKGARFSGDLELPGGALIFGAVQGRIRCKEGSLVLAEGSEFMGKADAPMVYICGTVRQQPTEPTEITGALMVAVSNTASGRAVLTSRQFAIHSRTFAGQLRTIE